MFPKNFVLIEFEWELDSKVFEYASTYSSKEGKIGNGITLEREGIGTCEAHHNHL